MKTTSPIYATFLALNIIVILPGCVAMPEKAGDGVTKLFQALDSINPFDRVGPELRSLVDAGNFEEAQKLFNANYETYFRKRFIEEKRPLTKDLEKLGAWHYDNIFKREVEDMLPKLRAIKVPGGPPTWSDSIALLKNASLLNSRLNQSM
jgi:hypothetical protein